MKKILLIITLLFVNVSFANVFSVDDVFSFKRVGVVAPSPDGKKAAFTVMQVMPTANGKEWHSSIYLKDETGKISLLTSKNFHASTPVWSPDGKKIIYLVTEKGSSSIWLFDLVNQTSNKWIEFNDITSFKWSPDGKSIAFVGTDKKAESEFPLDVSKDFVNAKLFMVPMNSSQIIAITPPDYNIVADFPDALIDAGFDFSPDSQSIVFAYQPRQDARSSDETYLAMVNLQNRKVTLIKTPESANQPVYSSDGKWIAYHSHSNDPTKLSNNSVIYGQTCVLKTSDFSTHCLSNTFNENPVIINWNKENNKIFVLDVYKTTGFQIYSLDLDPTIPAKQLTHFEGYLDFLTISLNQDHSLFGFAYETPHEAPEAFVSDASTFHLNKISHIQTSAQKELGDIKMIHWKSTDDLPMEGLLITPANYDPKKKYPLLVAVHGGPAGVWTTRYLGGCEEYGENFVPQCFAHLTSQGFIIFQPNPRGSTGYGKNFRMANFKDFGGGDYRDIMSGVDYLIQQNIADPDHLAIFGWSYGGYLSAWAISQTNRFKAAIDGDGLTDLISFSGTTDIPFYLIQYLGNPFWVDNKLYVERSPISYVKNISTPLLIIHGEKDIRVPLSQAQELYSALTIQNKKVKMLVSPKTGHVPDDANVIYSNVKNIQDWLASHK